MTLAEAVRTLPVGTRLRRSWLSPSSPKLRYTVYSEVAWLPVYRGDIEYGWVIGIESSHHDGSDDWEVVLEVGG